MSGREILLVEDDEVIRANLRQLLELENFTVRARDSRASALAACKEKLPDIAVLDVGLGEEREGGFTLCRQIREFAPRLPIVFLTSYDGEADKISGLRMGADDYLSKDISMHFLVVRLETLLTRYRVSHGPSLDATSAVLGPLVIDERNSSVKWRERDVPLPLTQYWMVLELAKDPTTARSPEQLMAAANIRVAPNTVAWHIREIRKRFREVDPGFNGIRTERGRGYRWVG